MKGIAKGMILVAAFSLCGCDSVKGAAINAAKGVIDIIFATGDAVTSGKRENRRKQVEYNENHNLKVGSLVKLVAPGRIRDTINETDALQWENPAMRELGGKRGWKDRNFKPKEGDKGLVVSMQVLDERIVIYKDSVSGCYVPAEYSAVTVDIP